MTREEKNKEIDSITEVLQNSDTVYLTDIAGLNAEQTTALRRLCFKSGIKMNVVKNQYHDFRYC